MSIKDNPTTPIPATLIPGDGIGPEITSAVVEVLDSLGSPFTWDIQRGGVAALEACGDALPVATLASIRRTRLALKGPLTTPVGAGFRSVNVRLRQELQLHANVRPTRTLVQDGRYKDVDLVIVRENLEGLYVAHEYFVAVGNDPHAVAISSGVNTREGARQVVTYAFEYALRTGRKKVTVVHKANVLKALSGIFLEEAREVGKAYAGRIAMDDRIVDACAMQLVLDPWQFDVIVTTNMFGDILSGFTAGLVGGLGMAPGANFGADAAIFEGVHGAAPDIAGKGIANPTSLLLAAGLMLDHVGQGDKKRRIERAVDLILNVDRVRTPDLGGTANTTEYKQALLVRLLD